MQQLNKKYPEKKLLIKLIPLFGRLIKELYKEELFYKKWHIDEAGFNGSSQILN